VRFRLDQHFATPAGEVAAAFVDSELLAHLCGADDLGRPELLERVEEGEVVRLRVRYAFTGVLSPPLSAVVEPARLTWVEESTLDRRTHRTEFHVVPDHYPGRLRCAGTIELHDDGHGGARRIAEGTLEVGIPVLGGKVERAVVEALVAQAATQARVVGEWLVSRRQAEA